MFRRRQLSGCQENTVIDAEWLVDKRLRIAFHLGGAIGPCSEELVGRASEELVTRNSITRHPCLVIEMSRDVTERIWEGPIITMPSDVNL